MCYGDPDHGRDGLYRKWLEDQAQAEQMAQEERLWPETPEASEEQEP